MLWSYSYNNKRSDLKTIVIHLESTYRDDSVPTGAGARRRAEAGSTSSSSAVAVASACHTVYMEIWNKATVD